MEKNIWKVKWIKSIQSRPAPCQRQCRRSPAPPADSPRLAPGRRPVRRFCPRRAGSSATPLPQSWKTVQSRRAEVSDRTAGEAGRRHHGPADGGPVQAGRAGLDSARLGWEPRPSPQQRSQRGARSSKRRVGSVTRIPSGSHITETAQWRPRSPLPKHQFSMTPHPSPRYLTVPRSPRHKHQVSMTPHPSPRYLTVPRSPRHKHQFSMTPHPSPRYLTVPRSLRHKHQVSMTPHSSPRYLTVPRSPRHKHQVSMTPHYSRGTPVCRGTLPLLRYPAGDLRERT